MSAVHLGLTATAAVGAVVVCGAFHVFSTFVMAALARLPAAQGTAAMQSINVTVYTPWFMGVLMGTAALCGVVVGLEVWSPSSARAWVLAGAAGYLVGVVLVTGLGNVPLNEALAPLDPTSDEAAELWQRYLVVWTRWNHVRTAASLAAGLCLAHAVGSIGYRGG